jgi:hypothetical protein
LLGHLGKLVVEALDLCAYSLSDASHPPLQTVQVVLALGAIVRRRLGTIVLKPRKFRLQGAGNVVHLVPKLLQSVGSPVLIRLGRLGPVLAKVLKHVGQPVSQVAYLFAQAVKRLGPFGPCLLNLIL